MTAISLLPLFSGPQVTIRIGEHGPAYQVSKDILCADSPYFSAMFATGHFKEGAKSSGVLEEIEGVVTPRSFQALVQWYVRRPKAILHMIDSEEAILTSEPWLGCTEAGLRSPPACYRWRKSLRSLSLFVWQI